MMGKYQLGLIIFGIFGISMANANASDDISIEVESLANVSGNGSLEACGRAVQKDKIKPVLVTVKHDESYYTTLTAPNDKWCVVFKRWTYNGKIDVSATTLAKPEVMNFEHFNLPVR